MTSDTLTERSKESGEDSVLFSVWIMKGQRREYLEDKILQDVTLSPPDPESTLMVMHVSQ